MITGTLRSYNTGDTLSANCSSFNSFPSATLNWYINGQVWVLWSTLYRCFKTPCIRLLLLDYWWSIQSHLPSFSFTHQHLVSGTEFYPFLSNFYKCLFSDKVLSIKKWEYLKSEIIRLKVEKSLFSATGDLKIKCTATIDPIYWKSNEESIQGFQERSYINFWNSGNKFRVIAKLAQRDDNNSG